MERDNFSPYASFLEFSETIFINLGVFKNVIIAGIISFILAIFQMINFTYKIIPSFFEPFFYLIWLLMIIILFHDGYYSFKFFNEWGKNFFRTYYFLNFDNFSIEGESPEVQLYNKMNDTFIDYFEPLQKFNQNELVNLFTNLSLDGDKGKYHFDVFLDRKLLDKKISWQRKLIERYQNNEVVGYIVGKIFDKTTPITAEDLSQLRSEIIEVTKVGMFKLSAKDSPYRLVVVSNSSFSDDALEYVKDPQNQIQKKAFDLIIQENERYKVLYIS